MAKYYVRSGQLEKIVIANSPKEAAYLAVVGASGEEVDRGGFYIDERGFRGPTPENPYFETVLLPEFALSTSKLLAEWGTGDIGKINTDED